MTTEHENEFDLAAANTYANEMLFHPELPGWHLSEPSVWPEVASTSTGPLSAYTGESHVEIHLSLPCRRERGDLVLAVNAAVHQFRVRMNKEVARAGEGAKVEWRIRPEIVVNESPRVVRYHDDGPDWDPFTDKRCTFDHRFWCVSVYGRCSFVPRRLIGLVA